MKDRIRQIMEDQHLNQQNFAQLIGKSTATLSSIFNDRTKPSLDIVDAIKKKLPQVNLEWLLYGTPPMYINKVEGAQAGASARGGNEQPELVGFSIHEIDGDRTTKHGGRRMIYLYFYELSRQDFRQRLLVGKLNQYVLIAECFYRNHLKV